MKSKNILLKQINELYEELIHNSIINAERNLENKVDIEYILMRLEDIMEG